MGAVGCEGLPCCLSYLVCRAVIDLYLEWVASGHRSLGGEGTVRGITGCRTADIASGARLHIEPRVVLADVQTQLAFLVKTFSAPQNILDVHCHHHSCCYSRRRPPGKYLRVWIGPSLFLVLPTKFSLVDGHFQVPSVVIPLTGLGLTNIGCSEELMTACIRHGHCRYFKAKAIVKSIS